MFLDAKINPKERLNKDLGLNPNYIRELSDNRAVCLVNQHWLDKLQSEQAIPNQFIEHDKLSETECAEWLYRKPEEIQPPWTLLLINTIVKRSIKVYRLVEAQSATSSDRNLSFSQLIHYVSETNYRNIWKDGRRKKMQPGKKDFQSYNSCIREGLRRLYGCILVQKNCNEHTSPQSVQNVQDDCHQNVLPALIAVECSRHFHIFHPFKSLTLFDCLTFSPCVLPMSTGRMLFIIHQLLHALRHIHNCGLHWGNLAPVDVMFGHDLWLKIIPRFWDDLKEISKEPEASKIEDYQTVFLSPAVVDPKVPYELVDSWVKGHIGNFEYLMELNKLAGREWGNPRNHPVLPWVMDLTVPHGGWRDLGKSKFRLNKGDRQLDLTYESGHLHKRSVVSAVNTAVQVPHHITEVLSDITYYVYKARVMPQSVLCKHVRSKWVPAEYPASMQRMQEWTPDECIPEFYTDPSIFHSIHSDLADLEVPWWSTDPADFVQKHMTALESDHVSERLHHWIDLTFGCRLSGRDAVRSKNVCLPLVDGHTTLDNCGMVQLFTSLHPHKLAHSLYTGRKAPKTFRTLNQKSIYQAFKARDQLEIGEKENIIADGKESGDDDSSSLSEGSANKQERKKSIIRSKSQMVYSSPEFLKCDSRPELQTIVLPKDYNPLAVLNQLESLQAFSMGSPTIPKDLQPIEDWSWHQQHQMHKTRDLLALGCLIGQMALPSRCHSLPKLLSIQKRYSLILQILHTHAYELPKCVCQVLELLLQMDLSQPPRDSITPPVRFPPVTRLGLPPPSAHQLLQPLVGVIPFAPYTHRLYAFLVQLAGFDEELDKAELASDVTKLNQISEAKVLYASTHLRDLMWQIDSEVVQILVPYLRRIFECPTTSLSAVWQLFDTVAQMLGPQAASEHLVSTLTSLLDPERPSEKHMKLYHRSCLLQWIVRLGFNTFLYHFVTLIIEATGGLRDFSTTSDGSRDVNDGHTRKGSHLRSPELEQLQLGTAEDNVSPYDEDIQPYEVQTGEGCEPEIFDFESVEDEHLTISNEPVAPPEGLLISKDNSPWNDGHVAQDIAEKIYPAEGKEETDNIETDASSIPILTASCDWPSEKPEETIPSSDQLDTSSCHDKYNISDVATESVLWLAHRMGPVLTAKHLSRNLLRMLTLCYLGAEQIKPVQHCNHASGSSGISLSGSWLRGDASASKVLLCLGNIADLYGENFVTLQYFPHCVDLIGLCKRRMTETLEAGLVGVVVLVQHIIPYLTDATLMDHLQDILIRDILYPVVRLISSLRFSYPGGSGVRWAITSKLVNVLYIIGSRIGFEMTRKHLSLVLQRFFSGFDKAHEALVNVLNANRTNEGTSTPQSLEDYLEIKKNSQGNDYIIGSTAVRIESLSPQTITDSSGKGGAARILEELKQVFTPQLAYLSYVPFCKLAGGIYMEQTLKNDELIRQLCIIHDAMLGSEVIESPEDSKTHKRQPSRGLEDVLVSGEFGKNVAVVGNRINVQLEEEEQQRASNAPCTDPSLLRRKGGEGGRHLKGNWRAYWEHEIGRSDKDDHFNFKQIKLQSFVGHNGSIRAIQILENENSFLTGSKDKTVKLWSLRSSGDGSCSTPCQWTYSQHRKSVFSVAFLDSLRLVGSCDSTVHVWDPFLGSCLYQLDSSKSSPVTVMISMPPPSTAFVVATTHSTIRFLDARTGCYQHEFKVSLGPAGLIRCMAVSPSGNWIAAGHSSGIVSVLDVRTGVLLGSRPCHEGEILQLRAFDETTFVSSSLDHSLALWSASDIKLHRNLRGPTEPVTCVSFYKGQVVTGTTANRIGVHTSVDHRGTYSSTRLLSDTFKGVLTSMSLLPINRLLLLGGDNGSLSLLC